MNSKKTGESGSSLNIYILKVGGHYRIFGDKFCLLKKANQFLQANETRGLSPHTIRNYGLDLLSIFRWLHDIDHIFKTLTHAVLYKFIEDQKNSGHAISTINRKLSTTQAFYRFVTGRGVPIGEGALVPSTRRHSRRGYRSSNSNFLKIKNSSKIIEPLTTADIQQFLTRIKRYRDLAIVFMMYLCGCRSCEVLALEISDINSLERRVRLRGKGRKERMMPLPDLLVTLLDRYFQLERPKSVTSKYVFLVLQGPRKGFPMSPEGLRKLFRYHRAISGSTHANAHRFRHTFGSEMARSNVRLATLQKMMGHSDPHTTLKYINLSLSDITEEYNKVIEKIQSRYESKI